jgi:hypothetical protein
MQERRIPERTLKVLLIAPVVEVGGCQEMRYRTLHSRHSGVGKWGAEPRLGQGRSEVTCSGLGPRSFQSTRSVALSYGR